MHRKMSPLRNSEYEGISISSYIIIFISKLNMINTMLSYIYPSLFNNMMMRIKYKCLRSNKYHEAKSCYF